MNWAKGKGRKGDRGRHCQGYRAVDRIPAAKVRQSDIKRLKGLEDRLKKKIIGQDEAVKPCGQGRPSPLEWFR